jgi:CRISPR/Cas system CSM-associated protein Csm4 (group 5 of RAMP superfamily)
MLEAKRRTERRMTEILKKEKKIKYFEKWKEWQQNWRSWALKNEDWTFKCREMSDYKTEILNGVLEHQEMSDEELYETNRATKINKKTEH